MAEDVKIEASRPDEGLAREQQFRKDECSECIIFQNSKRAFRRGHSRVTEALKDEGFGVLTDIDVKTTLKKKLDVEFRPYRVLGACNPEFAFQALKLEDKVGTMLPYNVIVQERDKGGVEVSAVDPAASMKAIDKSRPRRNCEAGAE